VTEYAAFPNFSPVLHDSNHTARFHNEISPVESALCPQSRNKRTKQRDTSTISFLMGFRDNIPLH